MMGAETVVCPSQALRHVDSAKVGTAEELHASLARIVGGRTRLRVVGWFARLSCKPFSESLEPINCMTISKNV